MADGPRGPAEPDDHRVGRGKAIGARAVAALILVGVVVVVVIQNAQRVTLRFWFVTAHVRLIWVIVVSLAIGGALGLVLSGRGRRRRRRRAASE